MKTLKNLMLILWLLSGTAGFTQNENEEINQKTEKFIQQIMSEYEIPGIAVGVIKNGEIYYSKGFGVQSLETGVPVSESTIFHMASVSKPFVATAIMQLVEAAQVNLDDPLIQYVPYFRMNDPRYREITVKQMLTHTSGLPDVTDYEWGKDEEVKSALRRYTLSLKDQKLIFSPGEDWAYSNMAYEVLGNLIENVAGTSFESYISRNILIPLEMKHSNFLIDNKYKPLYADGHIRQLTMKVSETYPYNPMHAPSSTLHSSIRDMCHWAIANLNRGEYNNRRILQAISYNKLWYPYSEAYDDLKIGLSWFLKDSKGEMRVQHGGGDLGFSTYFVMKPRKMSAVVVLTNHDYSPVQALTEGVWAIMEGKEVQMPKFPILIELSKLLVNQNVEEVLDRYRYLKEQKSNDYNFGENQLNILGYNLLTEDRVSEAIEIFKLNVESYPDSFNPYDSLGEAYMKAGKIDLAIAKYEKSVELNPDNENGKRMLEELKAQIK